jgi:exopolysaccharide production protein ExoZ
LFFVISGFVMVYTYAQRPLSPGGFLLNRVIRVVPLYWTFTILLFVVSIVSGYPLMQASRPTTIQFLQSLVFVPFRQASGVVEPLYFLGWTLNYEMMFYVLFALAIALGRGRLERVVGLAVAAVVGMAAIGSVLTPTSTWLSFYTSPILLAFAVGMGIALPSFAASRPGRAWLWRCLRSARSCCCLHRRSACAFTVPGSALHPA